MIFINNKKKYFNSSLFLGLFISKNQNANYLYNFRNVNNSIYDYQYNQILLGRNEDFFIGDNPWKRQIIDANNQSMRFVQNTFSNNRWMISQNNDLALPGYIPFKIYFDWSYIQQMVHSNVGVIYNKPEFLYSVGLSWPILDESVEFFVPLIYSKNLYFTTPKNPLNFYGFKLNLNKLSPQKIKKTLNLVDDLEI